jgi:hypothetical protein
MAVIFTNIKAKNKKSVKKSSQTILALNCGCCATAYTSPTASIFNAEIWEKNNI